MSHADQNKTTSDVPDRIRQVLVPLLEAIEYAEQTSGEYWEFAVEMDRLTALGLSLNDFRWLVRCGLVEHQREVTLESDDGRAFRQTGDLTFPKRSCFVLTSKGISLARRHTEHTITNNLPGLAVHDSTQQGDGNSEINGSPSANGHFKGEPIAPSWDSERRVLRVNGTIVKTFKWTAQNQEAILCVFEEEGWPPRIDDPLPPHPEQDSKRRLSDTIKCLNRKQTNPLIHFRGDGTGEGIVWEFVEQHDSDDNAS